MAKLKIEHKPNVLAALREFQEKSERDNPIIGERWYVVDYYEAARYSNEYEDGWTTPRCEKASDYFDTEAEAEEWLERYEPEKGAKLMVCHENLRRFTEEKWVNW